MKTAIRPLLLFLALLAILPAVSVAQQAPTPRQETTERGRWLPVHGSQIFGVTDGGDLQSAAFTPEGHIEAAIHAPLLPFGSVHVERLRPLFQLDGVYGFTSGETRTTTAFNGTVTAASNLLTASTGTTQYGYAAIQSRKRLRYRPGQGIVARFTAILPSSANSSYQLAGIGTSESGVYYGYSGTEFGILHVTGGVREIRLLNVSTKSNSAQNATITLADTAYTVALTNGTSTVTTAHEIASGTYAGWSSEAHGSNVTFVRNAAGPASGNFTVAGGTLAGNFTTTRAGANSTDTWVPQSEWNGDRLDGAGASGFTLDPAKGNVYQIGSQYLGFGVVQMQVETTTATANNPTWTTVHTFKFPNTRTGTIYSQPSFPFTLLAYSLGSTTNLSISTASAAGFVEGDVYLTGPRFTARGTVTDTGSAAYRPIVTVRNNWAHATRANQSVSYLRSVNCAAKHTQPVDVFLIRNAVLTGPNFTAHSANSACASDTTATVATFADAGQLIWSGSLGETGEIATQFADDITLQPGETVTLAARTTTGTAAYVSGGIVWREDQ